MRVESSPAEGVGARAEPVKVGLLIGAAKFRTHAVVESRVELLFAFCVGAVGWPENVALARLAFRASKFVIVAEKFASSPCDTASSFCVSSAPGELSTKAAIATSIMSRT